MQELLDLEASGTIQGSTLVAAEGQEWLPLSRLITESKSNSLSGSQLITDAKPTATFRTDMVATRGTYDGTQGNLLAEYMPLVKGESVLCSIKGNAYNASPNLILRLLGLIEKIVSIITGCPKTMNLIVTNRRIIVIERQMFFWVFLASASAKSVMPRSIDSMGYTFARSLIIFKSHYLEFYQGGVGTLVKSAEGKDRVYDMIRSAASLTDS